VDTVRVSVEDLLEQIFGRVPAEPDKLEILLRTLERLPFDHQQKKYVLMLWLSRAGIPLEAWMVGRLRGE